MSLTREHLQALQQYHQRALSSQDLQTVTLRFDSIISPAIQRLSLTALTKNEAVNICARLVSHSKFALITSDEEMKLTENHALQGLTLLATKLFDPNNNPDPEQVDQLLNTLFAKFPETAYIPAFNTLLLQAHQIIQNKDSHLDLVNYVKEKLDKQEKFNQQYLTDALAAFNKWKRQRKTYAGLLCRIVELADLLAVKYPNEKTSILEMTFQMFCHSLTSKELLPTYFAKFDDLIKHLIEQDNASITSVICHHLAHNKNALEPWTLISMTDHVAFKQCSLSDRRIIFNLISTLLTNKQAVDRKQLRIILDNCINPNIRRALLQRLNEFYQQPNPPSFNLFVDWVNLFTSNQPEAVALGFEASYIIYNNQTNDAVNHSSQAVLSKQLKKFKKDTEKYALTSWIHTRKERASQLNEFAADQLMELDKLSDKQCRERLDQTIVELYLHYASIEKASGALTRKLEKRLIKLLQIPKDDVLKAAFDKRESFFYKLHHFFFTGRGCACRHDKANDPVHAIIQQHLSGKVKSQITKRQNQAEDLEELDIRETSFFARLTL